MEGKKEQGKQLTAELIIQRSKTDKFDKIKNLNLWGNEIENISVLKQLPNVEVLSLSVNKITSLKDFAACKKVTELYLRKNNISDLSEVNYLSGLEGLKVLWLWDNPCANHPNYRQYVIKALPKLVKLDNTAVTAEERNLAMGMNIDITKQPSSEPEIKQPEEAPTQNSNVVNGEEDKVQQPRAEHDNDHNQDRSRSENILCAVLALLKELDGQQLDFVKKEVDKKIKAKK